MAATSEHELTRSGSLVLVATPIGNLDDLSPRAAATLAGADVVACEDTRRTGRLLQHIGVRAPLQALHDHNEAARADALLDRVAQGETVAVVSDAGTPGVSDPGYVLVARAVERGLAVTAVPGPSAVLHALVVSGLPTDRFAFEGFLPRRSGPRRRRLEALAHEDRTLLFYVAPHRAAADLAAMRDAFGPDRPAALARELTKLHEEVRRAPLAELATEAETVPPRGECTVVVAPAPVEDAPPASAEQLRAQVDSLVEEGRSRRDAIKAVVARTGLPKRVVYDAATSDAP